MILYGILYFFTLEMPNPLIEISGVQITFRRLTKVGATSKFWLKLTDVKRHCLRLDICQQHNLELSVNFYQNNIFFCVRKCRVLNRISVICGKFWFTSSIWRNLQLRSIDCLQKHIVRLHGLSEQHFTSYENTKNWVDSWITSKDEAFFRRGIRILPERWEKVVASDGQYFE